jgi:hypothetical protein
MPQVYQGSGHQRTHKCQQARTNPAEDPEDAQQENNDHDSDCDCNTHTRHCSIFSPFLRGLFPFLAAQQQRFVFMHMRGLCPFLAAWTFSISCCAAATPNTFQ